MSRSILVALLSVALSSCVVDPISPNIWSLSRTDANSKEVFLGGHLTLEACQRAGLEVFTQMRGDNGVLQCRLNCRTIKKDDPVTCEATEPVG
ncbi:hypothetical protein [Dongia deserti]|uniref:hypothetical protein n=1 Tax=Dongia deserti TaxID=2268030 RepID=UPI0013C4F31F|nr:hypothetical protein [Dongia deserti]